MSGKDFFIAAGSSPWFVVFQALNFFREACWQLGSLTTEVWVGGTCSAGPGSLCCPHWPEGVEHVALTPSVLLQTSSLLLLWFLLAFAKPWKRRMRWFSRSPMTGSNLPSYESEMELPAGPGVSWINNTPVISHKVLVWDHPHLKVNCSLGKL